MLAYKLTTLLQQPKHFYLTYFIKPKLINTNLTYYKQKVINKLL